MGTEIQDGCVVFYQWYKGKLVSIPYDGSVAADPEASKN
jgi:hypothetical protein|nr:MAG TPA: hypothetical protein [Caudoviricetes sp.]